MNLEPITDGEPTTDLAVDVRQLSRSFRGNPALRSVNLQITTGAVFGLVGLNGAGKTTLIRHLIGSLKAQSGTVRVLGIDPVQCPVPVLRRIGYLTEEDSLPAWMRIGDLIDFTRALYPTWDDAYARELCEMFSLSRGAPLHSLSKGGRARAGLLVAIAHRPELLILDEPSSGLDPIARSEILEAIIRTISQDGRTVLFSSHLLDEVDRVCDQIAMMHEGEIIESLNLERLQSQYVEIICRAADSDGPPRIENSFGWRRTGQEWSGLVPADRWDANDLDPAYSLIERRPVTLERWFRGRATATGDATGRRPTAEEPADV